MDRPKRSLESPTAVPLYGDLVWGKEKFKKQLKMQLEQQEIQRAHDLKHEGEQRTHELEMFKLKLDGEKSRP